MTNNIIFSDESMIEALEAFDPLRFKYNFKETATSKKGAVWPDWKRYAATVQYEKSTQFESLTKRDYAGDYANLHLIYDEDDEKKDLNYIRIVEMVLNKVIGQYINIDGMERLFSETYIEFEWEMHLSADYKKHDMKYYRDHFVHQIRDAYMMFVFLEELGFYERVKKVLGNEGKNKVSRFVQRSLTQQKDRETPDISNLHKGDEDFYMRNMIYMASFMAALFHDIGYPEQYYMKTSQHIREYIASLHELNANTTGVNKLYSLLQNSLLFRVVPFKEIEERISNVGSAGRGPEHGALSAIIFLLHFYENGAIYTLQPYKKAAVEIAALAIYNHTNQYGILSKKADYTYYRPCFSLNPISYLLRICDDLQEWDRLYFVISKKPSVWFCNNCLTPLLADHAENAVYPVRTCYCKTAYDRMSPPKREGLIFRGFEGEMGFTARRIFNVIVCDKLEVIRIAPGTTKEKLLIKLDYNPYKLLHIAYLNPSYAKYRIKELNSQKYLYELQEETPRIYLEYFVSSNPILIKVQILGRYLEKKDSWAALKIKMNEALENIRDVVPEKIRQWQEDAFRMVKNIVGEYERRVKQENLFCLANEEYRTLEEKLQVQKLIDYQTQCLEFYTRLYIFQVINRMKMVKENQELENLLKEEERKLALEYQEYSELCCLIEDCFLQFSRMYEDITEYNYYPERYYQQYKNTSRKDFLYQNSKGKEDKSRPKESVDFYDTAVERYLDMTFRPESGNGNILPIVPEMDRRNRTVAAHTPIWSYDRIRESDDLKYIDAFTDLYLFRMMEEAL